MSNPIAFIILFGVMFSMKRLNLASAGLIILSRNGLSSSLFSLSPPHLLANASSRSSILIPSLPNPDKINCIIKNTLSPADTAMACVTTIHLLEFYVHYFLYCHVTQNLAYDRASKHY